MGHKLPYHVIVTTEVANADRAQTTFAAYRDRFGPSNREDLNPTMYRFQFGSGATANMYRFQFDSVATVNSFREYCDTYKILVVGDNVPTETLPE